MMNAEITTKKVGTKWHGYIEGRPDLDETALSEEAVRRKMEQLRDASEHAQRERSSSAEERAS